MSLEPTKEDLALRWALTIDPFLRCLNAPYWKGKTKEEILKWIEEKEIYAAAWACTQSWLPGVEDNLPKINK